MAAWRRAVLRNTLRVIRSFSEGEDGGDRDGDQVNGSSEFKVPVDLAGLPVTIVPVSSLLLDDSPRGDGEDYDHIRLLAESRADLPPIVVHGQSLRVIDGRHRVRAAVLRGADTVAARVYHGSNADAFVLGVRMNITHGLPLSRADRTAAAVRIIGSHPRWSDRKIAAAAGIAAGSVAKIRQRSSAQDGQSITRVGKDGRERPLNSAEGRRRAGVLLMERPTASNREIAAAAGISASTVHDVRKRLRTGLDPILPGQRTTTSVRPPPSNSDPPPRHPRTTPHPAETETILFGLRTDPSLRLTESGRALLRCLDRCRVAPEEINTLTETVPDHLVESAATLAGGYAQAWATAETLLKQRWAKLSFVDPDR